MKRNNSIIEVNELSDSTKKSMKTRIISAIVAAAIAIPCILLGDWFYLAISVFVVVVGVIEIIRCSKPKHSIWLSIISIFLALLLTLWPILRSFKVNDYFASGYYKLWPAFESLYLSITILAASFFLIFFFVVIDKDTTVGDATFIFTASLILALGVQAGMFLRYVSIADFYHWSNGDALPSVPYFNFEENFKTCALYAYVVIATFATDIGAYFFGIFFGRHKMNPRISPKKTWEGFVGGVLSSFIFSFAFAFIFAITGHPIFSILDLEHWYFIVLLSLGIPLIAVLGDFVFSSFKRYYNIKDFGRIMPGHGGVLDRLDSLIFAFIAAAIILCLMSGRGGFFL